MTPKALTLPTYHATHPGGHHFTGLGAEESPPPLLFAPRLAAPHGQRSHLPQAPFPPGSGSFLVMFPMTSERDQLSQVLSALCWCHCWGFTSRLGFGVPSWGVGPPQCPLESPPPWPVGILNIAHLSLSRPGRGLCAQDCPLASLRPVPAYICPFFGGWVRQIQRGGAGMGT